MSQGLTQAVEGDQKRRGQESLEDGEAEGGDGATVAWLKALLAQQVIDPYWVKVEVEGGKLDWVLCKR